MISWLGQKFGDQFKNTGNHHKSGRPKMKSPSEEQKLVVSASKGVETISESKKGIKKVLASSTVSEEWGIFSTLFVFFNSSWIGLCRVFDKKNPNRLLQANAMSTNILLFFGWVWAAIVGSIGFMIIGKSYGPAFCATGTNNLDCLKYLEYRSGTAIIGVSVTAITSVSLGLAGLFGYWGMHGLCTVLSSLSKEIQFARMDFSTD